MSDAFYHRERKKSCYAYAFVRQQKCIIDEKMKNELFLILKHIHHSYNRKHIYKCYQVVKEKYYNIHTVYKTS